MESKVTSFLTFSCCFMFCTFMAFNYAFVKTPKHGRALASSGKVVPKPMYDASWKY